MSQSLLVVYATRYGSTQEVAETITTRLREVGSNVDVRPMQEVRTLDGYDGIVLGAAIYNGRWHPDAHQFLSRHQEALKRHPVAIFALGPLTTDDAAMQRSRRQLDKDLAQYPWLKPVALQVFVGKPAPSKLGVFGRLLSPAVDRRDWQAIRAWANALAARLLHDEMLHPAH